MRVKSKKKTADMDFLFDYFICVSLCAGERVGGGYEKLWRVGV